MPWGQGRKRAVAVLLAPLAGGGRGGQGAILGPSGLPRGPAGAAAGAQVSGHPTQGRTHPQSPDSVPSQGRGSPALPSCSPRPWTSSCFSPSRPRPSCKARERAGPGRHLSRLVTPGQSCSSKARKTACSPSPLREAALRAGRNKQINSRAGSQVRQGQPQREGRGAIGPERVGPQPGSHGTVLWAPRGADR